ncbi:molybdopterin-dependent oxidoreductase [Hyphobacterium marinum]|uniref:Molybdopterin-dependent oxidoreductase n=1 Tax=Hyphobacterium marinum TaxID=3116574 RepID=A0ABU7LUE2_9PROT|nr:molybdopterin-dependent oxidoreductase [Hyphobacterium sp. Y6023]MEE2565181.1 molybdopterin-dependent oxidoreductase [Hyphobacterium sp. Y6023]
MIRTVVILLWAGVLAACSPATGGGRDAPTGAVLTLYGDIETVDRGPSQAALEPLFFAYGIEFGSACVFSTASLASLDQHEIRVDFPMGGDERRFSGPLLRDVLAIAGPQGTHLTVTALDGYQRTIPLEQVMAHDVILAIRADGEWLGIGGYGPALLVWPRGTDPDLAGQTDDDWVWGVFAIESVTPDET